jgi:hypothetical protein
MNWKVAVIIMLKVVLPAFSILLGFWVAFVRPRDVSAWLLIGVLLGLCSFHASHELFTFLSISVKQKTLEAPPTGHYLRTVTFDINADNHTQTQQIA